MTTRPSVGRPPPQRSLSSTNPIQRPPPHRTLSQQFSSSSPTRRGIDGFVDLTFDGDSALGRHGPRIGASRLRVEISTDSKHADALESPKPSSAATPTWKPSLPPRGRPQLHFDVPSVSNLSPRPAQDGGQNEISIKPMPLPVRPRQHAPPSSEKTKVSPAVAVKKDVRPKPYILEVPSAAPRYSPNGHADFFPWFGNHAEDQFSEPVIRQGYYDKAQMTQNETGTARPTIFPALKHKSGLQTLSSLFTSVLAQRRAHGQITSGSTFKPPPRVTVTDTKREMWLKDLANPTISLRRLSRSIPHGIRGKVLLDQSLSKNIPIERAVWLAKCVGANELRSFRRKGVSGTFAMGGEAKWIRDFTVCVEQFVESIVGTCGEKDFKSRINYAIRLATHFHAEHLLDREHFMDWLVSSLENSQQAKIPMWLLITQIFWKDLLQYRKYGRRLSAALLSQLAETLRHPDLDILAPLIDRLRYLLQGLMASHPDSFVAPNSWMKHRDMILSNFGLNDDRFMLTVAAIDRRNSRLNMTSTEKKPSSRRLLINLLDKVLTQPYTHEMARDCWALDEEKGMLVHTVLEWAASAHRPGTAKIYIAVRILRSWARYGADISTNILNYLDSGESNSGRDRSCFYHLISELARSDHFSTPRYLQWLIARGGIYEASEVAPDGPLATRLVAELPLHNLSDGMLELRSTLLNRVGFLVDDEDDRTNSYISAINNELPGMQSNVEVEEEESRNVAVVFDLSKETSRTIKSVLGLELREKVQEQMVQPTIPPFDWDNSPMKGGTSAITSTDFNTIRRYLELIDDFSMLADVLKLVTSSNDTEVLASCADTLDLHLETFAAIGALNGLFDILMTRLRTLTEETDSVPRGFLVSLSDLASRLPEQKGIAQQLAQELARSDRKTAADACSPVSDHMAMVETAEVDFTDEIEKVLASGNSMDQATLERLFQRIILRLEESYEKSPEQQRSCGLLLTRLRAFDATQFDILMAAWVNRFLQISTRPSMTQVFGPLISFGCLALIDVITTSRSLEENSMSTKAPNNSYEILALLLGPCNMPEVMTIEEAYRFRIKQAHVQKDSPDEAMFAISKAFTHVLPTTGVASQDALTSLLESQGTFELLQYLVLANPDIFIQKLVTPLLEMSNSAVSAAANSVVDKLLFGGSIDKEVDTEVLLSVANDLSLPFCQVKLATMFKVDDSLMEGSEESKSDQLDAFDTAIEVAVASGKTTWASIVPLLDISIARHLCQRADSQFLALFPSPRTASGDDLSTTQAHIPHAENLLRIVDATAYSITSPAATSNQNSLQSSLASDIVAALNGLWLLLSNSQSQELKDSIIAKWLPFLLSFTTIHACAFDLTKSGHESRAKTILALVAIFLQLQALDVSNEVVSSLVEQSFDLALHLVDTLPDDVRQQCIRSLRDASSSTRLRYLFSFSANPTDWLVLSQKERVPGAPGSGPGDGRQMDKEKLTPFVLRRWEMLGEPTPNVGENDTSLSLTLFGARRG